MRIFAVATTLALLVAGCLGLTSSPAQAWAHHRHHGHLSYHHSHSHYLFAGFGHHLRHGSAVQTYAAPSVLECSPLWCAQGPAAEQPKHSRRGATWLRPHRDRLAGSVSTAGVGGTLAAKTHEIVSSCGSTVISGFRPGARIAGSGHMSLHASGRAVDIRGNPGCIYAHLRGWQGGYSVDYGAVRHVHISLGGREDGVRFSHYGGHHAHRFSHGGHRQHFAMHDWGHRRLASHHSASLF
jgi:hypothetical protein